MHEGAALENGEKWIMRSEIVYEWTKPLPSPSSVEMPPFLTGSLKGCEDARPSRRGPGVVPALDMQVLEKPEVCPIKIVTPSTTAPSVLPSPASNTATIEAFVERYENPAKSYATLYGKMFVRA